jgi:hypothetical protein
MQFHEHLTVALRVNGADHEVAVDARVTLLAGSGHEIREWSDKLIA